MKPRKILALLTAVVMGTTALAACSDKKEDNKKEYNPKSEITREFTATDIFKDMKVGWNLGNSLDSVASGTSAETAWGNPEVTESLIKEVKAAGFNTIRIPVTWVNHFGKEPDYQINEEWMDRVEEVVQYVLDNEMYAIIDLHHDGMDYPPSWLMPNPSDEEVMMAKFTKLWTQIAERFKDYDEKLIFAGMNELHDGYDAPTQEYYDMTNKLNQTFVDTVRATGGNNAKRILVVQAYNTNMTYALEGMVMPTDTIENRLMAEVHFYDPWSFAGEGKGSWGEGGPANDSWGQEDWVDEIFAKMKAQFYDKGIPVILGEYGASVNVDGYSQSRLYYTEYITKAALDNGMLPIWWDNGNNKDTGGDAFGLFDRNTEKPFNQDMIDVIMRAASGDNYEIDKPAY